MSPVHLADRNVRDGMADLMDTIRQTTTADGAEAAWTLAKEWEAMAMALVQLAGQKTLDLSRKAGA